MEKIEIPGLDALREQLSNLIINNSEYAMIYKTSVKLDKLITEYYFRKDYKLLKKIS